MNFRSGLNLIVIDTPQYGYTSICTMGIHTVKCADGSYKNYDDGSSYDFRVCRFTTTVAAGTAANIIAWFRSTLRGETFSLELGGSASGFYPFGPDKGDLGTFTVRVTKFEEGSWGMSPYGYVPIDVEMVMVTAPAYTPGDGRTEGVLQIGTVTGLAWPDPGYTPEPEYSVEQALTRSGVPYVLDQGKSRDRYVSTFTLPCCSANAATLALYVVGTGRGGDITVIPGSNAYMFGVTEKGTAGAGTYTTRLISGSRDGTQLEMRHVDWDRWEIPLKFWMVARTA